MTLSVLTFGAAQAQQATPPATPASPTATEELRNLQREARQLELLSGLSAQDRATFEAWQREREAYLTRARELQTRELRAYMEALRGGKTPTAARADAEAAVLNDRRALEEQATRLRTTAREQATRYPRLAPGLGVQDRRAGAVRGGRADGVKFQRGVGPRDLRFAPHRHR